MNISEERQEVFHKMIMPTTPVAVKSIFGALEYVSHCLPSFKLLDAPLIDIVKEGTNKDFTPTDIYYLSSEQLSKLYISI